ncbi:hypothetical protein ACROYT_G026810 [Oculina patagonica]
MDGYTTSLSFDNGNFNVSWMYNTARDELHFEVNVKTEGWVGFGFTFTPENMSNYDVVIGGQTRAGRSYFNDFFTVGLMTPVLDLKQSYTVDRATVHDGITTLRFHRPRDTKDLQDIQFNVTTRVFLVWAYHLVDDASDPHDFSMHSRRSHTSESYRLVYENTHTDTTSDQNSQAIMASSPGPSTPATTRTRRKSFGCQLGLSFLTISLANVLSICVH